MSRKYIVLFTLILTCVFANVSGASETPTADEMPDQIQQRYETLKTFQADLFRS